MVYWQVWFGRVIENVPAEEMVELATGEEYVEDWGSAGEEVSDEEDQREPMLKGWKCVGTQKIGIVFFEAHFKLYTNVI